MELWNGSIKFVICLNKNIRSDFALAARACLASFSCSREATSDLGRPQRLHWTSDVLQ